MDTDSEQNEKKIIEKNIIPSLGIVLLALIVEAVILMGLDVYGTKIGLYLLIQSVLIQGVWLALISIFASFAISSFANNKLGVALHYFIVSLFSLIFVVSELNSGLALDVSYSWILSKAGSDILGLKFLHGWTIVFSFLLALLLVLSDPRLSYRMGKDNRHHLYAHSKVISTLRLAFTEKRPEDITGNNADCWIIATDKVDNKKEESKEENRRSSYGFERRERKASKGRFNDLVRAISVEFIGWTFVKGLIGFAIATQIASYYANEFLMIQNYLTKSGIGWFDLINRYLSIVWTRMSFAVTTPLDFGIVEAPTFELLRLIESLIALLVVIWTIRKILDCIGEYLTAKVTDDAGINIRNVISNIFVLLAIWKINAILLIPSEVFIATTPYAALQTILWFIGFVALAILIRRAKPSTFSVENSMEDSSISKGAAIKIAGVIFIIFLLFSPSIIAMFTVNRYIEGKREEYVWKPGNLPSIEYTRWSHEVDNIIRLNFSAITMNGQNILGETRFFNQEAQRLNMKPLVGANNWMSIDNANVDITYLDGGEKWIAILTLISPPYLGDTDVWRALHLLQTHSEKMLVKDAATTEPVDAQKIIGGNTTPTFYYGEGGLWKDVDEVYLEIPGYTETHLPDYRGPLAYDDKPDYVYSGFWRGLKFVFVDWNFAFGNYGDIKTLVKRDVHDRVSDILLPGMEIEATAQPVFDGKGTVYLLHWVTLRHDSPHKFADYPEGKSNDIIRKFAVVLVNTKNGEISGHFVNTENSDYLLSYYQTFYPNWNNPLPEWLIPQTRYPERFLKEQISKYNEYFQDNFQKYQRNEFYELTLDENGNPIEDVRYIMMPLNGQIVWTAERPVEWYKGATRNLAGMYLAPGGSMTGQIYFIDFNSKTIIGPSTALNNVKSNTKLTEHPYFPQWIHGNILLYSSDSLYYVIPYYKQEKDNLQPQMIAVVNAETRATGYYIIQDQQNFKEISTATQKAFANIGVYVSAEDIETIGKTITAEKPSKDGTYAVILIKGGNGEIIQRIPLSINETAEIVQNK
ncbi:MAG: hypothetical protein WA063_06665 [Minisyncoccia bacterium]